MTMTPTVQHKLDIEVKEFREFYGGGTLPTVEELCAPLASFFDRLSDFHYYAESFGWLYDFGPRDEVQPRIREISGLLAAVVDQAGYIVRGNLMGETLDQRVALSSAMRMVVEALSGAVDVRDSIQALDDSEDYRKCAKALLDSGEVTPLTAEEIANQTDPE